MFIQKVLHVHRSLEETRERLSNLQVFCRQLAGVEKAVITADGVGQFDCVLPHGLRAHCVLVELPTEDPNQLLFRSTTGNVEISGLIEFVEIRDELTEVQLTMEYGFKSPVASVCDRVFRSVEQFFQGQLAALQTQVEGAFATYQRQYVTHLPQLAR